MTDNILFLMNIGDHCNLHTKLTPCINIIELAVTYFKWSLKTALKHVTMRLMTSRQKLMHKGVRSMSTIRTLGPRAWTLLRLGISDPPKSTSLFCICTLYKNTACAPTYGLSIPRNHTQYGSHTTVSMHCLKVNFNTTNFLSEKNVSAVMPVLH